MTGTRVDRLLRWLKWPFAILAVLALPSVVVECWRQAHLLGSHAGLYPVFVLGGLAYILGWILWFRKRVWGSAFTTLEHELTHALFGLLTFRLIRGIRISWSDGGHVRFRGEANWLILIGPYWFPTLTVALLLGLLWVDAAHVEIVTGLLGASIGFHLCSTWREIHPGQSDLRKVGHLFALCVLPTLNLISLGAILAYVRGGVPGAQNFGSNILSNFATQFPY